MARTVIGNSAIDMMSTDEEKEKNRKERRLQDLQQVDPNIQSAAMVAKEMAVNNIQQQSAKKYDV